MVDMPERIWAFQSDGGQRGWLHTKPPQAIIDIPVEYVRADLFDALTKERDRLKDQRDYYKARDEEGERIEAEFEAKCDRIAEERDSARAERDRLAKANAELLTEAENARMTLAAWDQGGLPNDMTLREICEARIDDLSKYMARAESMDALPFDRRDIERGLILFRTSNNAHGAINFVSLTWKVDSLPQSSKDEMASIMRNIAHSLETSALLTKHKATSTEREGE